MRTSDRVYLETAIIISGTDSTGQRFEENTKAVVLSRRGAEIVSKLPLVPQQVLAMQCLKTGVDTGGPNKGAREGCHFGIARLQPEVNVWGMDFPVLDGSESSVGRVVVECADCGAREVVHLDVFELEVLQTNECLQRPCKQCGESSLGLSARAG